MKNQTYTRWAAGEPRIGRVLGPLANAHPLVGVLCPMCALPLRGEDPVRLFVLGLDQQDPDQVRESGSFRVIAQTIHAECDDIATAKILAQGGTTREATPADTPDDTQQDPAPDAPVADPGDLDDLLRYATIAADMAAIDAIKDPKATGADITRVSVRAAFQLALGNQLITVVPRDQWPRFIAATPPYTQPEWARRTTKASLPAGGDDVGVVDEP